MYLRVAGGSRRARSEKVHSSRSRPCRCATAYAALFNGGALLTPNYDGVRKVRAQFRIDR